jgi:hypothetical protein
MKAATGHQVHPTRKHAGPPAGNAAAYLHILTSVQTELGMLHEPAEEAFLAIGSVLGGASGILGDIKTSFATLVERLNGPEATTTASNLMKATEQIESLAGGEHGSAVVLDQLGAVSKRIGQRLGALTKVVTEVDSLSINAKIQASLIVSGGIDFTVFTSEINRLGVLATQTIGQTSVRLRALERSIASALAGEQSFERDAAGQLAAVRGRLAAGLAILVNQHRTAASAVERVGHHSTVMAQRVAACMTDLQFNDTACQRIEHVRDAIAIVRDLAASGDEENIDTLVGAVCRLQALQLSRTATEYRDRVEALVINLRGIANDASGILIDADAAIHSEQRERGVNGHDSFISSLESDITLAARLLNGQASERERVNGVMQSVSAGFADMEKDIEAIHSIDSDMRVMGLNATFKCGRLGRDGLALGVIAQELRSCSKRTEEFSGQISDLLKDALSVSKSLGTQEDSDSVLVSELGCTMSNALVDLGALSVSLDATLEKLHRDSDMVTNMLRGAAARIVIHRRMHEALTQATEKLAGVADLTGIDGADIEAMGERIRTLLAGHYTMQSERLIHQIFADCFGSDSLSPTETPSQSADTSIDDLLF